MSDKWRNLLLLASAELLAMALWFSASAVVPQLTAACYSSASTAAARARSSASKLPSSTRRAWPAARAWRPASW